MKNYAKIIAKEWNTPIKNHHIKTGEHAPVEVNDKPTLIHPDAAVRMFKLMQEELWEFKYAYEKGSSEITQTERLIEVVDAIGDMQYILDGIKAQHGLQDIQEQIQDEIHRSNLTKLQGGEIITNEIGKIQKPDTYESPNLKDILK